MEKFTIDLDQVLNDFEYKELTDQYTTSKNVAEDHYQQNQSVAKHTINNVFHSLNEYLNTNINVSSLTSLENIDNTSGEYSHINKTVLETIIDDSILIDGDSGELEEVNRSVPQNMNENLVERIYQITDVDCKGDSIHLDLKSEEIEDIVCTVLQYESGNPEEQEEQVKDVDSQEFKPKGRVSLEREEEEDRNYDTQIQKTDEKIDSVNSEELLVDIDESVIESKVETNEENVREKTEVKEGDLDVQNEKLEAQLSQLGVGCGEDGLEDNSNTFITQKVIIPVIEEMVITNKDKGNNTNNRLIETETIHDDIIGEIDGYISNKDILKSKPVESERDIIQEEEVNPEEDQSVTCCKNDSVPDLKNTSKVKNVQSHKSNAVKFDDLNLDDSEINKLLEELEDDEDLNFDLTKSHQEAVEENKDESSVVAIENVDRVEIEVEENLGECVKTTKETNNQDGSLVPSGNKDNMINPDLQNDWRCESSLENEKMNLTIINYGDSSETQENDSSEETVEEIVSDIGRAETLSVDQNDVKIKDIFTTNDDNAASFGGNLEKELSQDSLSRPQNLPLGELDESKRNIDLIGDPGSTPFNNVYIDKEIARVHESESENSTSSSPTFSDGSNSASTASTEEVQDEIYKDHSQSEVDPPKLFRNIDIASEPSNTDLQASGDASHSLTNEENISETVSSKSASSSFSSRDWLGKEAPLWIPDSDATSCLHCDMKFTVLKRRHHCRACGLVLCSKCCHLRFRLEYLDGEGRVCNKCHDILNRDTNSSSSSDFSPEVGNSPAHRPNPNNPSEYCSTVSPLQQVSGTSNNPPAVMVPVGVLKRKGSNKGKSNKSVMFCDGIRPGSDLTNLDNDFNYNTKTNKLEKPNSLVMKTNKSIHPTVDPSTDTFIPQNEDSLPPVITFYDSNITYSDYPNTLLTVEKLRKEQLTFVIHLNLFVHLKVIDMNCCINKLAWCFSTEGLINVGQDEIVILLEYLEDEALIPKDIFFHINSVFNEAVKGSSVKELGLSLHSSSNFLGSKNHAGFVYIRPTFQCLENVIKPKEPYLIGILIHRWETPWAKLFPLRLVLRLGAEYRYYPSPIISTRNRDSVFVEVGHTIINLLADFRNFSYSLPQIRGLTIHMEDKNTTVKIPTNRYDQVVKSLNNSSDHILAFAGNFSMQADSHLVCIQDTQGNENCYSTHAINIHNKPRKITGASFIVFSGALKSSSGLTAKSNIVEDGLMIQVLPEHMQQIRDNLRAMKNHTIPCGCVNAASDETVNIVWGENDLNFNSGVVSVIDSLILGGIPSIRVHNGKNHVCTNATKVIRWTEVFIIQNADDNPKNQDPVDISRVSETIAKATCDALVKHLDQLVLNNLKKIGIRTTLQTDNVSYFAGSNGVKLPSIYMNSLDNELIPVLHRITSNLGDNTIVLELIFRILNI